MISKLFLLTTILPMTLGTLRPVITTLKYSKFRVKPTIVNGATAATGQFPYMVSIKEPVKTTGKKIYWMHLCGGSIVGLRKLLTASHCFEAGGFYYANHPQRLRVVAGSLRSDMVHTGTIETTEDSQWRKIIHITVHEDFYFPDNDIAIVFTEPSWEFTWNVNSVPPATRSLDYGGQSICVAAGFGQTGKSLKSASSKILLWAQISLLSRIQCNVLWELDMKTYVCSDSAFTDVAAGDSGGPLACVHTLDPKERLGKDLLVGIVSGKNYDKTTLFTRVSAYKDWLVTNFGCGRFGLDKCLAWLLAIKIGCVPFCFFGNYKSN